MFYDAAHLFRVKTYVDNLFITIQMRFFFHHTLCRFNSISDISAFHTVKVNVCKNTNATPITRLLSPLHLYAPRLLNEKSEKPYQILFLSYSKRDVVYLFCLQVLTY